MIISIIIYPIFQVFTLHIILFSFIVQCASKSKKIPDKKASLKKSSKQTAIRQDKSTSSQEKTGRKTKKETEKKSDSKEDSSSGKIRKSPLDVETEKEEKLPSLEKTEKQLVSKSTSREKGEKDKISQEEDEKDCRKESKSMICSSEMNEVEEESRGPCCEANVKVMPWTDEGGQQVLKITNNGSTRQALKLKCSDNTLYLLNPVFSVIEPGKVAEVTVSRGRGSCKPDRIVVCTTKFTDADHDLPSIFKKEGATVNTMEIPQMVS